MLRGDGGEDYWKRRVGKVIAKRKAAGPLYDEKAIRDLRQGVKQWERVLEAWSKGKAERKVFQTASAIPLKPLYTPADVKDLDYSETGFPGVYPYLRGVYPDMYRGRPWTMRMFSGFGTPEDTNRRLKLLLQRGETGLSIAFDMPTLYGYDCDHQKAHGEVGRCGVNVSSLKDMEAIFDGVPLDEVSTSMTINAPAAVLTCMYAAVGKKSGVPPAKLRGTVQADMLKEYIAQKEWVYPPEEPADEVPHSDLGGLPHVAAAAEQHRPDDDRGTRGSAGGHAVAAHKLLRRGLGASDREGGGGRPEDAADHRGGDGRVERGRPPRGFLLRGVVDRADGGGGLQVLRQNRVGGRNPEGHNLGVPPEGDRGEFVQALEEGGIGGGFRRRSEQVLGRGGGEADRDPEDRLQGAEEADSETEAGQEVAGQREGEGCARQDRKGV